jgi:signal transduction histidine kinase
MTIRARLTYWYAGVTLASILLLAAVMYYEFVIEAGAVAAAHQPEQLMEEEIGEVLLFYGVPSTLLIVLGGWWLLRKALAPLNDLASAAERLHIHNLREPLPRTGNGDEVDRLSEVLNATNARMENSFKQIREFTLQASHELKTPLAVLHGEIETAMNDPATTPAQREVYGSQLDEIQRLTKIVESLTLLAKADAGQVVLAQETVRLDELVQDSFADAQILAQPKEINVTLDDCAAVTVRGDHHRLRQLLLNLTENAIKYNQPHGRVVIALKRNGSAAEFTIANTGQGIPASLLPRIFDRFFRGDESRNRQVEGCGLGLSIAKWIVKAHGGDIQIASAPERLTTVSVKLPLLAG